MDRIVATICTSPAGMRIMEMSRKDNIEMWLFLLLGVVGYMVFFLAVCAFFQLLFG